MPNRPNRPGKHPAQHRAPTAFQRARADLVGSLRSNPVRPLGSTVVATGALAATVALGGSTVLSGDPGVTRRVSHFAPSVHAASAPFSAGKHVAARAERVSRSAERPSLRQARHRGEALRRKHLRGSSTGPVAEHQASIAAGDPREVAAALLPRWGWDSTQFSCLDALWVGESDWNVHATNPISGAYGIPQALPPEKMSTAGPDWQDNPVTQITWGLNYIQSSYGSPCSAEAFKEANGWY